MSTYNLKLCSNYINKDEQMISFILIWTYVDNCNLIVVVYIVMW